MAPSGQSSDAVDLSKYFQMPEKAVAQELGICLTSLKKMCRQQGINRWPYRKIKSLDKRLRDLEDAMSSASDPSLQMVSNCNAESAHGDDRYDAPSPSNSEGTDASVATTPRQNHEALDQEYPAIFSRSPSITAPKQRQSTRSPVSSITDGRNQASCRSTSTIIHASYSSTSFAMATAAQPTAAPAAAPPKMELSDEDLISMLAECVGKSPHSAPAPAPARAAAAAPHADAYDPCDPSTISLGQRDAEILSELVGCAAPFQMEADAAFPSCHDFGFPVADGQEFSRAHSGCEEDFADGFCWAWTSGPQEMR